MNSNFFPPPLIALTSLLMVCDSSGIKDQSADEHGDVDEDDIGADDAFDHLVGVEGSVVVPALLVRCKFSLERKLED